jgi:hypothetical protein
MIPGPFGSHAQHGIKGKGKRAIRRDNIVQARPILYRFPAAFFALMRAIGIDGTDPARRYVLMRTPPDPAFVSINFNRCGGDPGSNNRFPYPSTTG